MKLEREAGPAHEGSDRIRHTRWKGHFTGSRENKLEVKDCCSKLGEMNLPTMEVTLGTEDPEFRNTQEVNFMGEVETEK